MLMKQKERKQIIKANNNRNNKVKHGPRKELVNTKYTTGETIVKSYP